MVTTIVDIYFIFLEPPIEVLQEIRKRKLKEEEEAAGKKEREKEKEKTEL